MKSIDKQVLQAFAAFRGTDTYNNEDDVTPVPSTAELVDYVDNALEDDDYDEAFENDCIENSDIVDAETIKQTPVVPAKEHSVELHNPEDKL